MAKPNQSRFDESSKLGGQFPPYVEVKPGFSVEAVLLGVDRSNLDGSKPGPKERYVFVLDQDTPIEAFRGGGQNQESVKVRKGEEFTMGNLAGLAGLEEYAQCGPIKLTCTGSIPTGKPNEMYTWELGTTPETRQLHAQRKASLAKSGGSDVSFPHGANASS